MKSEGVATRPVFLLGFIPTYPPAAFTLAALVTRAQADLTLGGPGANIDLLYVWYKKKLTDIRGGTPGDSVWSL